MNVARGLGGSADEGPSPDEINRAISELLDRLVPTSAREPMRSLRAVASRRVALERWTQALVDAARVQGRTWDEIGAALGMTRQGAWVRYKNRGSGAASQPFRADF